METRSKEEGKMAATVSVEGRQQLFSVPPDEQRENGDNEPRNTPRTRGNLDNSRQSSEFYPRDTTINYIWQYSQAASEFNPADMSISVDQQREDRDRKRLLSQGFGRMPEQASAREENASKMMRKRSNIQRSLQLLDEAVGSPRPLLATASPLVKTAGTPSPLLRKTPLAQLRHSTYTPSGMSSVVDTDYDQDMTVMSDGGRPDHPLMAASFSASRSVQPGFPLGAISLLDQTGVTAVTPMKSRTGIEDHLETQGDELDATNISNVSVLTDRDPIVSVSSGLFQEFKESFTDHMHSTQVFDLVSAYEEACQKQVRLLHSLIKNANPGRRTFAKKVNILDEITQEGYTWRLIGSLFSDRLENGAVDEEDMMTDIVKKNWSEKKIINALYEHEGSTRQNQLVVDWLERNAKDWMELVLQLDNVEYFSESVCWENTLHELQQGGKRPGSFRPLVKEMDPDAPVRQKKPLADLDLEDETRLLKYLFVCIRAGKFEEAIRICTDCGQAWRAATLQGWRLWHDPNTDGVPDNGELSEVEGNPYRDVWKAMCWNMAAQGKFSLYEKAMYAVFSGNLNQLLPACESWEDYLWGYYKVMVDVRVEQELRLNARQDRQTETLPSTYWDQALTPEKIFAELKACPKEAIKRQSLLPHHVIQTYIILNDVEGLLRIMNDWLLDDVKPANHMLRFMAHFVLFLRAAGLQSKDELCFSILKAYVQNLIDEHQVPLVATYTATLPPGLQIETYAYFLEEIVERKERQKCLEYAEAAKLDIHTITKTVVENIRGKDFKIDAEFSPALDEATSNEDKKKIEAIEWLIFDPSQRAEALKQSNAIMRCFIASRKHAAAHDVFEKIPPDSIDVIYKQWQMRAGMSALPPEDDNAIREYLCVKAYLDAHDAFNDWFQHFHNGAPARPSGESYSNFTEKVAFEQRQKQYKVEVERWQNTLDIHTKATVERINNVLLFPEGWMVDQAAEDEPDRTRSHQMKLLRELCIPALCFLLHNVYHSTSQYKECLELANTIASEQYELYKVFRKDELQKFLTTLRESSLSLLETSMDPLGYDLP